MVCSASHQHDVLWKARQGCDGTQLKMEAPPRGRCGRPSFSRCCALGKWCTALVIRPAEIVSVDDPPGYFGEFCTRIFHATSPSHRPTRQNTTRVGVLVPLAAYVQKREGIRVEHRVGVAAGAGGSRSSVDCLAVLARVLSALSRDQTSLVARSQHRTSQDCKLADGHHYGAGGFTTLTASNCGDAVGSAGARNLRSDCDYTLTSGQNAGLSNAVNPAVAGVTQPASTPRTHYQSLIS